MNEESSQQQDRSPLSAKRRAAGQKGGAATRDRHGVEHYQQIGRRGGEATQQKYGEQHYREAGRVGGSVPRKREEQITSDLEALIRKGRQPEQGDE